MTILFIPLLPIIAATIIGSFISWISSRFKASRLVSLVLTFAVIIVLVLGSFTLDGNGQKLAETGTGTADMIFKLYPLAAMYTDAVCSYRMSSFLMFTLLSAFSFAIFSTVLSTRYKAIHTSLMTSHASSGYIMKPLEASSPFHALYKKELRRYFSSSVYVLNTGIGMILLLVMSISLLFVSPGKLGELAAIPQLSHGLGTLAPFLVSLFVTLSCTAPSSISLEGNHL